MAKTAKKRAVAKKARRGRPTTLTAKIKLQLVTLWSLSGENVLSDSQICEHIGITHDQLKAWLQRSDELRHLRTCKRASVKIGYLQRLNALIDKMENDGQFDAAAKYVCWLLEKQFPKNFGSVTQIEIEGGPKIIKLPFKMPDDILQRRLENQRDTG